MRDRWSVRRISAASAVTRSLCRSVVVKTDLPYLCRPRRSSKQSRCFSTPELAQASVSDGSWTPGGPGMSHQEETPGRPRICWRDYVSQPAWERLGITLEDWDEGRPRHHHKPQRFVLRPGVQVKTHRQQEEESTGGGGLLFSFIQFYTLNESIDFHKNSPVQVS